MSEKNPGWDDYGNPMAWVYGICDRPSSILRFFFSGGKPGFLGHTVCRMVVVFSISS